MAASMKSMVMAVVDVGRSMGERVGSPSSNETKLSTASSFYCNLVLKRMAASKTAEFGLVIYGSNETSNFLNTSQRGGYEGVQEVVPMERPNLSTLQYIHGIRASEEQGDLIDGLVVGQDVLIRINNGKAFNRILLLVTDGETQVEGVEDLETIVTQMKNITNFALYVIMVGKVNNNSSVVKQENSKLLRSLAESIDGRYGEMENPQDGFYLVSSGLGFGTRPVLGKIPFEIAPNVKIPCAYWKPTMTAKMPAIKKVAAGDTGVAAGELEISATAAAGGGGGGDVKRDTSYRNPEDVDQELQAEERVKGYKYGPQYIPITTADEDAFKLNYPSGITVIGAIPVDKIPRFHFLEGPLIIQGAPDLDAALLSMAVLSLSLRRTRQALLVRVVLRANADPYLAAVMPSSSSSSSPTPAAKVATGTGSSGSAGKGTGTGAEASTSSSNSNSHTTLQPLSVMEGKEEEEDHILVAYRLPCADDVREFAFPPLSRFEDPDLVAATPELRKQQTAMSNFVDSMTVSLAAPNPAGHHSGVGGSSSSSSSSSSSDVDSTEIANNGAEFTPQSLLTPLNPVLFNFYDSICKKVVGADGSRTSVVVNASTTLVDTFPRPYQHSQRALQVANAMYRVFPLEKVEKKKRTRYWTNLVAKGDEEEDDDEVVVEKEKEKEDGRKKHRSEQEGVLEGLGEDAKTMATQSVSIPVVNVDATTVPVAGSSLSSSSSIATMSSGGVTMDSSSVTTMRSGVVTADHSGRIPAVCTNAQGDESTVNMNLSAPQLPHALPVVPALAPPLLAAAAAVVSPPTIEDVLAELPEFKTISIFPGEDFQNLIQSVDTLSKQLGPKISQTIVRDGMNTMRKIIDQNIHMGAKEMYFRRVVSWLPLLREVAIAHHEWDWFNKFMYQTIKPHQTGRHRLCWELIAKENITLISQSEVADSSVTHAESVSFLQ